MKAVILAGGQGTRLRPLTSELPKPLAPLLEKPVIFHILDLLRKHGVEEAVVTTGYRGDRLEAALDGYAGLRLTFLREESPMGTAGGVKRAARGWDEPFFVVSGDAMCDFNLRAAWEFHHKSGGLATLFGSRVDDPREYGLICADDEGRVRSFAEKPSFAGCVSDLANTGIYLLSPEVLAYIQKSPCDFAKDVFPALLRRGLPVFVWEAGGYWRDIGDIRSYLRCQAELLAGRADFTLRASRFNGNLLAGRLPFGDYALLPPVYIGQNVSIGAGAVVGPYSVVGRGAQIGALCRVERSVLGAGVSLGERVALDGTLVCAGACFEDGASAGPGSAVGPGAWVRRDASVGEGTRVFANKVVDEGVLLREDLRTGNCRELLIGEEGFCGQTNVAITPEVCLHIGMGAAGLFPGASVGIGYSEKPASRALALACGAGVVAAGGSAWDFGACIGSQFDFCLQKSGADTGLYLDAGQMAAVRAADRDGLPLPRERERLLESAVNRREYKRAAPHEMGARLDLSGLARLYFYELIKQGEAPVYSEGMRVRSASPRAQKLLEDALARLGCPAGEAGGLLVRLAPDGKSAGLFWGEIHLPPERLLAAVCLTEFARGNAVALPEDAPQAIDALAGEMGCRVLRYRASCCGGEDREARRLAAAQPFLRDGLMMAVRVLSFLEQKKMSPEELDRRLPRFCVGSRYVPASGRPGRLLQKLRGTPGPFGGVELRDGEAIAMVRPLKSGHGLMITAESAQSETAAELCDRFEAIVRRACGEPPSQTGI